MPALTIKNIPDKVYKRLKQRAERHKRSLNSEILHCLASSVESGKVNTQELIKKARTIRESIHYIISDKKITRLKQNGRL